MSAKLNQQEMIHKNQYDRANKKIPEEQESKERIINDSISNIDSSHQNERDESINMGQDITRSIVKKNANNSIVLPKKSNNTNTIIVNENLDQILYNKNKKKTDTKIERLDFLSSSFQNSFQSNSNNMEINKIPINNNKVFYNFHNIKSESNKNINKNTNTNNKNSNSAIENKTLIENNNNNFPNVTNQANNSKDGSATNLSITNNNLNTFMNSSNDNNSNKNQNEFSSSNVKNSNITSQNLNFVNESQNKNNNNISSDYNTSINALNNIVNNNGLINNNSSSQINFMNNYNTILSGNENSQKSNDLSLDELKKSLDKLDEEKTGLEKDIIEMRKKIKNIKKEDYNKKISLLEKEREDAKKTANHYLHLCSQLAEEVIVLRNQLDKYSHFKKDK